MTGRPTRDTVKVLPELFGGRRLQAVAIALLALVSTAATLALPWLVGSMLGAVQSGRDLGRWTWTMTGVGIGAAAAGALATYLLSRLGQQLVCRLRVRSMRHSLGLSLTQARCQGSGNLAARLTSDAAAVKGIVDIAPIQLPIAAVTLIGTLVIMGLLDWVLLLLTVAAFLLAAVLVTAVVIALRRKYVLIQERVGALTQDFVAALEALRVIKAHGAESLVSRRLADQAEEVARVEITASRQEALVMPVITLGQQIALITVIIGGGARLVDGQLTLSEFVAFLLYLFQLVAPLLMLATGLSSVQGGLVAKQRFDDLFALPVEDLRHVAGLSEPMVPAEADPALRFEQVTFSYDERPALKGVDLVVPRRGMTALVGPSGAGKTTVLALVERFADPDSGRIEVLGKDATAWSLADLRGRLSYVDQANTLLCDTVRNNLALGGAADLSDELLMHALEEVGLAEDVRSLPQGLDTPLGAGQDLSGGQQQRLALARATLSDAPLVLLDEPSSQLDSLNEQRLRRVVDGMATDRAVLVVAHRMSTVQQADHVVVMVDGRVVGQGRHHDLLSTCPPYAELVSGQVLDIVPGQGLTVPAQC